MPQRSAGSLRSYCESQVGPPPAYDRKARVLLVAARSSSRFESGRRGRGRRFKPLSAKPLCQILPLCRTKSCQTSAKSTSCRVGPSQVRVAAAAVTPLSVAAVWSELLLLGCRELFFTVLVLTIHTILYYVLKVQIYMTVIHAQTLPARPPASTQIGERKLHRVGPNREAWPNSLTEKSLLEP
jgi:hypothetical protein